MLVQSIRACEATCKHFVFKKRTRLIKFNFGCKDQGYKKEGPDPIKGSNQLYVEISNKRSMADFTSRIYIIHLMSDPEGNS